MILVSIDLIGNIMEGVVGAQSQQLQQQQQQQEAALAPPPQKVVERLNQAVQQQLNLDSVKTRAISLFKAISRILDEIDLLARSNAVPKWYAFCWLDLGCDQLCYVHYLQLHTLRPLPALIKMFHFKYILLPLFVCTLSFLLPLYFSHSPPP